MTEVGEEALSSTETATSVSTPTDEDSNISNEVKLLFFGTFYHDSNIENNVDLVQFKETTRVTEVRVIPLGATVTLPNGSFQLGATNPSEFKLEVYYNDLQDPTKSTFELLSHFAFNDKSRIQLLCDPESVIITDGILVRGLYSTLTVAMYGYHAKPVIKEPMKEPIFCEVEEKPSEKLPIETETKEETFEFERRNDKATHSIGKDERETTAVDVRVSSFIPSIEDIPQAIPTINTRVMFDPILRNLPPEEEEPFEDEMLPIEPMVPDVGVSPEDRFEPTSKSPHEPMRYSDSKISSDKQPGNYPKTPLGPDGEPMEVEDISDGEVPSSADDEDSCPHFPAIKNFPSPIMEEKQSLPPSPTIVSEPSDGDGVVKEIPGADLVSPVHDQLSDQDDSIEFPEPGFEEIVSDEEMPEYSDPTDYFQWRDFTAPLMAKPFNHLAESFQVVPLKHRKTEDSLIVWKKTPEESWEQLYIAVEKFSKTNFEKSPMESWVEMLENLIQVLPAALSIRFEKSTSFREQVESTLWFWVDKGLNYDLAKEQPILPFKVRHVKAGVRLVQCLANCGGDVAKSLLRLHLGDLPESTVQHLLLDLLMEQHMNTFTKLLIIRTLDATVGTKEGYIQFMASQRHRSCYERLLSFSTSDSTPTRISFAFRSLVTKINVLIGLEYIEENKNTLVSGATNKDMINEVIRIYDDIHFLALNVCQLMSHPLRILPAAVMVELPQLNSPGHDPKVSFIRVLEEGKFIPLSAALLTSKEVNLRFVKPIRELLQCLMDWEVGLIYMSNQGDAMTDILKSLFQVEEDGNSTMAPNLAYYLEVMKCIDKLTGYKHGSVVSDEDSIEQFKALQTLFSFLNTSIGRKSLVHVFSKGNFIIPLLEFCKPADEKTDKREQYTIITRRGFAIPLLVHIIQMTESLSFLQKYGEKIHELISGMAENVDAAGKLVSILPFLTPALTPALLTYDGIDQLSEIVRNKKDELFNKSKTFYENFGFPPELTTVLRILYSLGVPIVDEDVTNCLMFDSKEIVSKELKHKLALVKMHSVDCVSMFSSILIRITEEFSQPTVHTYLLAGATGDALVSLVSPLVKLLRLILAEVIKVRKAEFRDTSAVPSLLQTHALMTAFPQHASSYDRAQEVAANIIQTLLSYTIPALKAGEETEEELNKSTWTAVVSDIIKYTLTAPYTFIPGLQILSEMLPLPLPISTKVPLSEKNSICSVKLRRLWSVYLHCISSEIQDLLGILCDSTNSELLNLLKRVCVQLADLSSSTCLVVCRAIIDPIWTSLEADMEQNNDVSNEAPAQANTLSVNAWVETCQGRGAFQCSVQTARRLGLLVSLISRSAVIKSGVLQAIRGLSKVDEKYSELISHLASILIPLRAKPTISHLQAQDHVITIFQSLCDVENGLLLPTFGTVTNPSDPAVVISNSLPQKDYFNAIISVLLEYINTTEGIISTNASILEGCFRVLGIILDTDYGFYHFKIQLEKFPGVLKNALKIITKNIEQPRVFETVTPCMVSLLGLLKLLIYSPEAEPSTMLPNRGAILPSFEMCKCLAWLSFDTPTPTIASEVTNQEAKSDTMEISESQDAKETERTESIKTCATENSALVVAKSPLVSDTLSEVHPLILMQQSLRRYQERSASSNGNSGKTNHTRMSILEYIDNALDTIQALLNYCSESNGKLEIDINTKVGAVEPSLPQPELLSELFSIRPVFVVIDRPIPESWLSSVPPSFEMESEDSDTVLSDLNDISRTYFLEYDVIKEVERLARLSELQKLTEPEKRAEFKSRSYDDYNNMRRGGAGGGLLGLPPRKPAFNSSLRGGPMRGGFSRGLLPGPGRGGQHFDPFRSRPPNTSRPPSLHVDDFVAMESGHGPSGQNYNKGGMRSGQDNFSNRSRGNNRGGQMGRPYNDGRSRPFRQPQSGNPYYQQQRHDSGQMRGRMGRGRGYNTGANERWTNDNHRGNSAMGNYGRQDHNRQNNYDDKFRSANSGGSARNSNIGNSGNRQQPYARNNYREVPSGPRSGGGGGPMQSSQRWKDKRNFPR